MHITIHLAVDHINFQLMSMLLYYYGAGAKITNKDCDSYYYYYSVYSRSQKQESSDSLECDITFNGLTQYTENTFINKMFFD